MTTTIQIRFDPEKPSSQTFPFSLLDETGILATGVFKPPWDFDRQWVAVYKALELSDKESFPEAIDSDTFREGTTMALFEGDGLVSRERFEIIGEALYKALFSTQEMKDVFRTKNRQEYKPVIYIQLPEEGSALQSFPWELLHDRSHFLFNNLSSPIIRNIAPLQECSPIRRKNLSKILMLDPRPKFDDQNSMPLPKVEGGVLKNIVTSTGQSVDLVKPMDWFSMGTIDALRRYFAEPSNNNEQDACILHIDTHGDCGWLCSSCDTLNPDRANHCKNISCRRPRGRKTGSKGYLAFEDPDQNVHWVSGEDLCGVIPSDKVQLVVLSACKSGQMGGPNAYHSVAGALSMFGIPAVVAMQYSVKMDQAKIFTEAFYQAIRNGIPVVDSIASGRNSMSRDHWYRPVLYLRHDPDNPRGDLFDTKAFFTREEVMGLVGLSAQLGNKGETGLQNIFGPLGLGKSNLLYHIRREQLSLQPVIHFPVKNLRSRWFEEGRSVPERFVRQLYSEVIARIGSPGVFNSHQPDIPEKFSDIVEQMIGIARKAVERGERIMILIDDLDALPEQEWKRLIEQVLYPLSIYTLIFVTSERNLRNETTDHTVRTSMASSQISTMTLDDVEKDLGPAYQHLAEEVFYETGGLPSLVEIVINQLHKRPTISQEEFINGRRKRIRACHNSPLVKRMIWGSNTVSKKTIMVFSLLRRIDPSILEKILPLYVAEKYDRYQADDYLKLIERMGRKLDWDADGGYTLHPSIKGPAMLYIQYIQPKELSLIHGLAAKAYQSLLEDCSRYNHLYLVEMLYYQMKELQSANQPSKIIRAHLIDKLFAYFDSQDEEAKSGVQFDDCIRDLDGDIDLAPYHLSEALYAAVYGE